MKLVDVNVWVACAWPRHVHHDSSRRWMDDVDDDLAFCRVTEMGVLRLITSPAVTGSDARTRSQAWDVLLALQADPRVRFLQEPAGLLPLWVTYSKQNDRSHQLWTDDYLAAFAQAGHMDLITLDRKLPDRYPVIRVEVIR